MTGIEPVYLGPDLSALDIVGATQRVSAQVIVLGIRLVTKANAEEVSAVAAAMPRDGELWIAEARISTFATA